jgi:hypothetical protein
MKAWGVTELAEYSMIIVFADTRGKALFRGMDALDMHGENPRYFRVTRLAAADGEPHRVSNQEYLDLGLSVVCSKCEHNVFKESAKIVDGIVYCEDCISE